MHAYETWGFRGLSDELIEALNIWARFIYGPMIDDRERDHRRRDDARQVRPQAKPSRCTGPCSEKGPVEVPREFVFMDRAAIGLGGVFLHLGAGRTGTGCSTS